MKKLLYLFIIILIPCIVFADAAAPSITDTPSIKPYVAEVINKDGAYFYGYDLESDSYIRTTISLDYKTKVSVYDEYNGYAVIDNYEDYLRLSDIKKIDQTYEEYQKEINPESDVSIRENKTQSKNNNTIIISVVIAIIVVIISVFIIVKVNKGKEIK